MREPRFSATIVHRLKERFSLGNGDGTSAVSGGIAPAVTIINGCQRRSSRE
jgi:hypothetical protein